MICENGKKYTEEDMDGNKSTGYEYDFTEFVEDNTILDPSKVKENPSAYVDYIPSNGRAKTPSGAETTLDQRITDIEDTLAEIIGGEE